MKRYKILLILLDSMTIICSLLFSLLLRFDAVIPHHYVQHFLHDLPIICFIFLTCFIIGGLYKSLWKYASIQELINIAVTIPIATLIFFLYGFTSHHLYPKSVYLINMLLLLFFTSGIRISYRLFRHIKYTLASYVDRKKSVSEKKIMLVGAGEAGRIVLNEYEKSPEPESVVALIDDDPAKKNRSINGIPIIGNTNDIPKLAQKYNISKIILTLPSVSPTRISDILHICQETNCKVLLFPGIQDSLNTSFSLNKLRSVEIEDLLGREEIKLDNSKISDYIYNQTILVTGGGGSIGSELCRQIGHFNPRKLVIFDIYENNAYDIQQELLRNGFPAEKLEVIIGSVRDMPKINQVFNIYHPDIIFHAAAHKHVPLMEDSPSEVIKNNIFGTYNVAQCALNHRVKKFILISTDKAVNPTNVMGASKRFCEIIIQALSRQSSFTEFAAVRFGNVLGSNGSVIPLFKKQIEAGGPVTVTDPEIIRYFMTIPEAVRLILQAMSFAKGGEIFVLDMGKPVKILDLAKNLIKLSGLKLGEDIEIKYTGLRPGEKLYEELLIKPNELNTTSCDKIFVEKPLIQNYPRVMEQLRYLHEIILEEGDAKEALKKVVPTYHPNTVQVLHKVVSEPDISSSSEKPAYGM